MIVESGNHYLAAVKGNQPKLYQAVQEQFVAQETYSKVNKGTRNEVSPVVV